MVTQQRDHATPQYIHSRTAALTTRCSRSGEKHHEIARPRAASGADAIFFVKRNSLPHNDLHRFPAAFRRGICLVPSGAYLSGMV